MHNGLYRYVEDALRDYRDDCQRMSLLEEYLAASSPPEVFAQGGEAIAEQDLILDRRAKNAEWRVLMLKT